MVHPYARKSFQTILLAALLAALLLSGGARAHAQGKSGVNVTARIGFDWYCKDSRWTPLHVTVENQGPDVQARVRATYGNDMGGSSAYSAELSLPTSSRKESALYLVLPSGRREVRVDVLAPDDAVLASTKMTVTCIADDSLLFGLLVDNPTPYNNLGNVSPLAGSVRVAQVRLADLPERAQGWDALDALVVSGVDTGPLSDGQRQALSLWLSNGGKLLVVGGANWQGVAAGLGEFLPLELNGTRPVSGFSGLQDYFGTADAPLGPATLASGSLRPGAEVLVAQDGVPLLVQRRAGFGKVFFLAADPGLQPLSNWGGMQTVYNYLLGMRSARPIWGDFDWSNYSSNQALSTLPALDLPPFLYIFCWLGLYVLIVGPLNYLVLRRLKRQELAWVSVPALVILFTAIAYLSGFLVRGSGPILNRLAVSQGWEGQGQARVRALVGIYSPDRTKYTLKTSDPFTSAPYNGQDQVMQANHDWLAVQRNADMLVPDVLVESGGLKAIALRGDQPTQVSIKHDLVIHLRGRDPLLNGSITNTGQYTLQDALLITPGDWQQLGNLAPGKAVKVQVSLAANSAPNYYSFLNQPVYSAQAEDDKTMRRNALMQTIFTSSYNYNQQNLGNWGIFLVGWLDEPQLPVSVQDRSFSAVDTTLSITMLSPTFRVEDSSLNLPPTLFEWEASGSNSSPYFSQNISTVDEILHFRLAFPLHYSALKMLVLRLNSSSSGNGAPVAANLWDWSLERWVPVQNPVWGDNVIPDPGRFVGPGAEIRLKVDQSPNIYELDGAYLTMVVAP